MKPILHIGPPKTATTSLQASVIPLLGRPYQIKPAWVRDLTDSPRFESPGSLPPNIVISDERIGGFMKFPPEVIAARCAQVFDSAQTIYVARDPVALFYSLYRQILLNTVAKQSKAIATRGGWRAPFAADLYFDAVREDYAASRRGFFASVNLNVVRNAFGRYFDFMVIDFDLLKAGTSSYVSAFAQACGSDISPALSHENKTRVDLMEMMLESSPPEIPASVRAQFAELYSSSRLSPDREDFLRSYQYRPTLHAFASSFQFRKR